MNGDQMHDWRVATLCVDRCSSCGRKRRACPRGHDHEADTFPQVHIEADGRKVVEFGSWGFGDGRTDPRIDPFIGRSAPACLRIDLEQQGLTLDLGGPPWTAENVERIIEQLELVVAFKRGLNAEAAAAERERIAPLVEAERDCSGGPRFLGVCGCLCHQTAAKLREAHDD